MGTYGLPISGIAEPLLKVGSGMLLGLPQSVFVFAAIAIVGVVMLGRTTLGRNIIAIGGNPEASRTSGIKVGQPRSLFIRFAAFAARLRALL